MKTPWNQLALLNVVLTVFLTVLLGTPAFAGGGGHTEGNGGDAVQVGDQLILRDFAARGHLQSVDDSVAYIRNLPGMSALFEEVMMAHPEFGLTMLDQFKRMKIWVTQDPLPVLPTSLTTATGPAADVQFALRFDDDVLVSEPALRRVGEAYGMFHEALHGIVSGRGPIHHLRVWNIMEMLRRNRGRLSLEMLQAALKKNEAFLTRLSWVDWPMETRLARGYFYEPDPARRCVYQAMLAHSSYRNPTFAQDFIFRWKPIESRCSDDWVSAFLRQQAPKLFAVIEPGVTYPDSVYVSTLFEIDRPGWLSSSESRERFRRKCAESGSESKLRELSEARTKLSSGLAAIQDALNELSAFEGREDTVGELVRIAAHLGLGGRSGLLLISGTPYLRRLTWQKEAWERELAGLPAQFETLQKNFLICRDY